MARVRGRGIESGTVSARALRDGAVQRAKIEGNAVGPDEIRPGSVKGGHIEAQSIRISHLHPEMLPYPSGGGGPGVGVVDFGETTALTGYSRRFYITTAATLDEVTGSLSTAGTTSTIAEVAINGVTVATLTIPANTLSASVAVGADMSASGYWQMRVTQAGAGALGLAFFGRFS